MKVFRGHRLPPCTGRALTIGNFDGVHRGHQAMLALLRSEARHRGLPSCVLTFEPHPRNFFAQRAGRPHSAPARIATLRDKLSELERCGIDEVAVLRFDTRLAAMPAGTFTDTVLLGGIGARYVLVGDDFRFGAGRAGDYALLDAAGQRQGFDVARMLSYEVHGLRVSSSAVREALASGDMAQAGVLMSRPYSISGHVVHGAHLGRELGFRTLNLRFPHARPAAQGIFVVRVEGLTTQPLDGVASLGVRPTVEDAGQVLLETHVLDWPGAAHPDGVSPGTDGASPGAEGVSLGAEGGYGRLVRVELLHKLHDERRYASLDALRDGIAQDVADARRWLGRPPHGR